MPSKNYARKRTLKVHSIASERTGHGDSSPCAPTTATSVHDAAKPETDNSTVTNVNADTHDDQSVLTSASAPLAVNKKTSTKKTPTEKEKAEAAPLSPAQPGSPDLTTTPMVIVTALAYRLAAANSEPPNHSHVATAAERFKALQHAFVQAQRERTQTIEGEKARALCRAPLQSSSRFVVGKWDARTGDVLAGRVVERWDAVEVGEESSEGTLVGDVMTPAMRDAVSGDRAIAALTAAVALVISNAITESLPPTEHPALPWLTVARSARPMWIVALLFHLPTHHTVRLAECATYGEAIAFNEAFKEKLNMTDIYGWKGALTSASSNIASKSMADTSSTVSSATKKGKGRGKAVEAHNKGTSSKGMAKDGVMDRANGRMRTSEWTGFQEAAEKAGMVVETGCDANLVASGELVARFWVEKHEK